MKVKYFTLILLLLTCTIDGNTQNSYKVIRVINELRSEFQEVRKILQEREDLNVFNNAVNKTIEMINNHSDSYHNWGLEIPLQNLIASEIDLKMYNTNLFNNTKYWEELKKGLLNYGSIESRKIETKNINLLCKQQFVSHFPNDIILINEGDFQGFFVNPVGDIFIPGVTFYKELVNRSIEPESFKTTPFYFKSHYITALQEIENEDSESAIQIITEILDQGLYNEDLMADLFKYRGYAYSINNKYKEANADFNKSIEISTDSNQNISDIFTMRGCLNKKFQLYDNALKDFKEAYRLEGDELKKEQLQQYIQHVEGYISAN